MRHRLACIFLLLTSCGPKSNDDDGDAASSGTTSDTSPDAKTPPAGECPDSHSYQSSDKCFCEMGYDWCVPEDPNDVSCCSAGATTSGDDSKPAATSD